MNPDQPKSLYYTLLLMMVLICAPVVGNFLFQKLNQLPYNTYDPRYAIPTGMLGITTCVWINYVISKLYFERPYDHIVEYAKNNIDVLKKEMAHFLTYYNQSTALSLFIKMGGNIHQYYQGEQPIHLATRFNRLEICRILIKNGANVNGLTATSATPLMLAAEFNYIRIAKLLLEHGADVNLCPNNQKSPLYLSIKIMPFYNNHQKPSERLDNINLITLLIKHGAALEEPLPGTNVIGTGPLLPILFAIAASSNYSQESAILNLMGEVIEAGIDPLLKDDAGNNLLDRYHATQQRQATHTNAFDFLRENGVSLTTTVNSPYTRLLQKTALEENKVNRFSLAWINKRDQEVEKILMNELPDWSEVEAMRYVSRYAKEFGHRECLDALSPKPKEPFTALSLANRISFEIENYKQQRFGQKFSLSGELARFLERPAHFYTMIRDASFPFTRKQLYDVLVDLKGIVDDFTVPYLNNYVEMLSLFKNKDNILHFYEKKFVSLIFSKRIGVDQYAALYLDRKDCKNVLLACRPKSCTQESLFEQERRQRLTIDDLC